MFLKNKFCSLFLKNLLIALALRGLFIFKWLPPKQRSHAERPWNQKKAAYAPTEIEKYFLSSCGSKNLWNKNFYWYTCLPDDAHRIVEESQRPRPAGSR